METEAPNRRVTTIVTLTALSVLLVIAAVTGFQALFAPVDEGAEPTASPTCTPQRVKAGKRLTSAQVTVSVFNAGNRSGLASRTLDDLVERGFKAGATGNAPGDADVKVVQVWTADLDDPAALLVARQFGPRTVVREGHDLGVGVDVVVGSSYRGMVPAKRFIRVEQTEEVCVPE